MTSNTDKAQQQYLIKPSSYASLIITLTISIIYLISLIVPSPVRFICYLSIITFSILWLLAIICNRQHYFDISINQFTIYNNQHILPNTPSKIFKLWFIGVAILYISPTGKYIWVILFLDSIPLKAYKQLRYIIKYYY
jgi:hypothetical protein